MGRHVRNAHPIAIAAEEGVVTVDGPILADEVDGLLAAIRSVPGVMTVENELEVHETIDEADLAPGEEDLADRQ
jgi:hypothetical protein